MQRLYSTFPCGLPGAGLIVLRATIAIPLIHAALVTASSPAPVIVDVVTTGAAILLLVGLWTPIAGVVLAAMELFLALSYPAESWRSVHVAALCASLAMLGPGGCSVDARLFGRKELQIPQR